jgi:hypothetical protein
MKLAIQILKKALKHETDDRRINIRMISKSNTIEMNMILRDYVRLNNAKIKSLKKLIRFYLKKNKSKL